MMNGRYSTRSHIVFRCKECPAKVQGPAIVMAHPQLSIVIPAYNESARIADALERVMSCVAQQGWDAEVLVVDDGSKDDTAAIVQRWMHDHPRLHLVQNPGNRGK